MSGTATETTPAHETASAHEDTTNSVAAPSETESTHEERGQDLGTSTIEGTRDRLRTIVMTALLASEDTPKGVFSQHETESINGVPPPSEAASAHATINGVPPPRETASAHADINGDPPPSEAPHALEEINDVAAPSTAPDSSSGVTTHVNTPLPVFAPEPPPPPPPPLPSTNPQIGLRLRMKIWTDPRTRKRYLMPMAFMRDLVKSVPVTDIMYAYAMSDEDTQLVTLTAGQWNALPFFYFQEDGQAPRAAARAADALF